MPTYEFRCRSGHLFEQFFGTISSAPSEFACPQCGEPSERLISGGAGLHFKGSGFYITDYGKDGKKSQRAGSSGTGAESKPAAEGGKAEGSSGAAKPEAKSESKPDTGSRPSAKPGSSAGE